ncbi:head completion/stabilization protein [Billgrantia montanilacus]|uniref:Glucose-6-phosphate isomerase n=1 Tax=Billgrantia montanilacus TaxID=2282305 RepID=A0A368U0Z1_9GAMM|nr:head completion/stabilization protein [Halomonas montanilacus]RCV89732.1 glucose-6-phosphate isomerase [Halomonas montanilacus]
MSLIAAGYGTEDPPAADIENNGFWPAVSPADFRLVERLDSNVTSERAVHALAVAMADINRQLSAWQTAQMDEGADAIGDVAPPSWLPPNVYPLLYKRAVYATAHATLLERYREISATGEGDERGEAKASAADEYRRDARWAVSEITGRNHTTVELI